MKFLAWPEEPARCQQGRATPMIDINTSLLDFSHRRFPGSEVEGLAVVQFETFCGRKVQDGPCVLFSAGLAFQRTHLERASFEVINISAVYQRRGGH
jgi:hypothetical protein